MTLLQSENLRNGCYYHHRHLPEYQHCPLTSNPMATVTITTSMLGALTKLR